MPTECMKNLSDCIYIERNAEISEKNQTLEREIAKLKEENKNLKDLVIKLNMRSFLDY